MKLFGSTVVLESSSGIIIQLHQELSPVFLRSTAIARSKKYVNRVVVPQGTQVIQDSGAFSDGPGQRLSFREALQRQEKHAARFDYSNQVYARASYDVLIDEVWSEDDVSSLVTRAKRRWTEAQADFAVEETVQAAKYLHEHRNGLACILSAQGVSAQQYRRCVERILPYLQTEDVFGLGGWCITGKLPAQIMPVFRETMYSLIPFLAREGVQKVHIWGVCYASALAELLWLCDQWSIALSTDSIGPQVRPARGQWGYAEWRDPRYQRVNQESDRCIPVRSYTGSTLHVQEARGLHRAEHVRQVREWLAHFRETPHYPRSVPRFLTQPRQLTLAM